MKKLYIAIDFDGTIVEDDFPNIGELIPTAKEIINKWHDKGHAIIINSCREGKLQLQAEDFLTEQGIKFDYFNKNHPDLIAKYGNDCRKIGADIYIDDKCFSRIAFGFDEDEWYVADLVVTEMEMDEYE